MEWALRSPPTDWSLIAHVLKPQQHVISRPTTHLDRRPWPGARLTCKWVLTVRANQRHRDEGRLVDSQSTTTMPCPRALHADPLLGPRVISLFVRALLLISGQLTWLARVTGRSEYYMSSKLPFPRRLCRMCWMLSVNPVTVQEILSVSVKCP